MTNSTHFNNLISEFQDLYPDEDSLTIQYRALGVEALYQFGINGCLYTNVSKVANSLGIKLDIEKFKEFNKSQIKILEQSILN